MENFHLQRSAFSVSLWRRELSFRWLRYHTTTTTMLYWLIKLIYRDEEDWSTINPGGYPQKNWVGVCGPLLKAFTLFMTKICDIPYPVYDLTKNSKPYLSPGRCIKILLQTCVIIGSLVQTNVKLPQSNIIGQGLLLIFFDNDENVASQIKNIPISRLE